MAYGPEELIEDLAVSRETVERLAVYEALLRTWSRTINLIGPREIDHFWRRHALDSLQLLPLAPRGVSRWIDLGAGAGFPGLVIAASLAGQPQTHVTLVEANAKKCAFLREAARAMGAPAEILCARVEDVLGEGVAPCPAWDVVSARAFAPLPRIITYAKPALDRGAIGLFPKGADTDQEIADARAAGWRLDLESLPSLSDPQGRVLRIRSASKA